MNSENQNKILNFLYGKEYDNNGVSFKEIYDNCSPGYYCNGHKHFGAMLSRMVKAGLIERVKKGVYRFKRSSKFFIKPDDPQQTKLFS